MIELSGKVIHGKGLGHQYGMPTANIDADASGITKGVYAGYAYIDNEKLLTVINVGTRPSVDYDERTTIEALIIGFDKDIYGKEIKLELYHYLRPVMKMKGLNEVKKQVDLDIEQAKELLNK